MKTILLPALLFSMTTMSAELTDTQLLILDQSFEKEQVNLESPTYKIGRETYSYEGTCYEYEYDTYTTCDYSSGGSYSGGSSSGSSTGRGTSYRDRRDDRGSTGRGTSYRDRRDSRNLTFDKNCTTHTRRTQSYSYSCTKYATRRVTVKDGGKSIAAINVNLENASAIKEPIEFSVYVDQGFDKLGRDINFSTKFNGEDTVLEYVEKNISGKKESKKLFKMNGDVTLKAYDVSHAKVITGKEFKITEITTDALTLELDAALTDLNLLALELEVKTKFLFGYGSREKLTIALKDLEPKTIDGKTVIQLPFEKSEYMSKERRRTYEFLATVKYTQKFDLPMHKTIASKTATKRMRIDFKKGILTPRE